MARYSRPLTASGDCHLEIVNSYKWIADPRFGSFKVYVDGKAVGNAPLASSLKVAVLPGRRTVRVRLWWYLSPLLEINAPSHGTICLDADIPRAVPFLRRMILMCFLPFRSLSLVVSDPSAATGKSD